MFILEVGIIPHLIHSFANTSISGADLFPFTIINHQRAFSLSLVGRGRADGGCWCQAAEGDTDDPQVGLQLADGGGGWGVKV